MTKDDIIEMARKSGALDFYEINPGIDGDEDALIAFAKLVAAHTLMNIDPNKFMPYHERNNVNTM